ncbi:Ribonuclease E [Candidatus Hepatincola sp. Av]
MTNKKILIDASQVEETRVAVLNNNNNLDDYEFEVATTKELKGNIYFGRITKVEASLQAAFVDYGGKKQGFLPFSEIALVHFNLPKNKLDELYKKQAEYKASSRQRNELTETTNEVNGNLDEQNSKEFNNGNESDALKELKSNTFANEPEIVEPIESESTSYGTRFEYSIKDVIKPDQLVIVQVVKEERGNKGASLTTYLSIPGRYCVLMPNTPFSAGISKKITNISERQRLRDLLESFNLDENTNLIIRTAAIDRPDEEIMQDYKYITTVWNMIQQQVKTMKNPGIVFEEGILIKRVIRDLYSGEIEEILVEGKKAFHMAQEFAKLIAPDIAKKIRLFHHPKLSLFKFHRIEDQVKDIYSPAVFLKSGGYIVINTTEALVSIDVNSGKTKGKRNIEETAFNTNLEAANVICKQLKLRDIGGIIVIDFIDMENLKNRAIIEKEVKDLLKEDKAKIHIGKISNFGLLEISRQRIKASLVERFFKVCNKCQGVGFVKPLELNALQILRNLESDIENKKIRISSEKTKISMPTNEAFYLLNNKRKELNKWENAYKTTIRIECDDSVPYPFYTVEPDDTGIEEVEAVLLLQKEIEDSHYNKNKFKHNNNFHGSKPKKHVVKPRNHGAKYQKPENKQKTPWLKKVLGL